MEESAYSFGCCYAFVWDKCDACFLYQSSSKCGSNAFSLSHFVTASRLRARSPRGETTHCVVSLRPRFRFATSRKEPERVVLRTVKFSVKVKLLCSEKTSIKDYKNPLNRECEALKLHSLLRGFIILCLFLIYFSALLQMNLYLQLEQGWKELDPALGLATIFPPVISPATVSTAASISLPRRSQSASV